MAKGQKSGAKSQDPEGSAHAPAPDTINQEPETFPSLPVEPETRDEKPETNFDEIESAIQGAPFSKDQEGASADAAPNAPPAASQRVEVLFNGRLGPKLLTRGDVTGDPDYVRLLGDPRGLVREVMETQESGG